MSTEFYGMLFDLCVWILEVLAAIFGTTYIAINIWIFCIIGPLIFLTLLTAFIMQLRLKVKYKKLWQSNLAQNHQR